MKNILFFNIYKNTTAHHDRNSRVNSILNPIYYVTLSNEKGKDIYRKSHGLKLDSTFTIEILPNSILQKAQNTKKKHRERIYSYLLAELIDNKKHFGIHSILYGDVSQKERFLIEKWLYKQGINNENLLDDLIYIEKPLQEFFKDRKSKFNSSWESIQQKHNHLSVYVYGTIDIRRNKVKFLIAEENIIRKTYDAPVFGLHYIFHLNKGKNNINKLCSHLFYLENENLKEKYYTWIENTLEMYYPPTKGNELQLQQQDFYNFFLTSLDYASKNGLLSNKYIREKRENITERTISGNDESIEEVAYKKEIAKLTLNLLINCITEAQKTLWHLTPTLILVNEYDKFIHPKKIEEHSPFSELQFISKN